MIHLCDDPGCTGRPHCQAEDVPRVRRLLEDISLLVLCGSFRSAGRRFRDLRIGLELDLQSIERGAHQGEEPRLRECHEWLEQCLHALSDALSCDDAPRAQGAILELWQLLRIHRANEPLGVAAFNA